MKYQPVIGLEIHTELKTNSKMFCSCKNDPDEKRPNFNVCPICLGHPGTLPVINQETVRKVIKTGLSLNCEIPESSKFDRKNYFYPDLPKGYQISQYDKPFCKKGYLDIDGKRIGVTRVHLEEDTGRLLHPDKANHSLVDLNRAGIPLMELVTEPDIVSGKEARRFAEELRLILKYLGVSDADMEKGQMRAEVNISLRPEGAEKFGTKVEIKNLNSFRSVEKSIDYEIERQTKALESGEKIIQETRGWDDAKGITVSQREKEEAHDYRYFPEPDLPTLELDRDFVSSVKKEMPELPQQKRKRFATEYFLDEKAIEVFVLNKDLSEYLEKIVSEFESRISLKEVRALIKTAANYLITDLQGLLQGAVFVEKNCKITPENFAEFITMIQSGKISSKIAKMVLEEMFKTGADPEHIIEEKGISQISDEGEIEAAAKAVIDKNSKAVEEYKKGKTAVLQFLVGQVMAQTSGRAEPNAVQQMLQKLMK